MQVIFVLVAEGLPEAFWRPSGVLLEAFLFKK